MASVNSRRAYSIIIERDETGTWIAHVRNVPGCHTYGRTLNQVRRRIREALSLWIEDAQVAELAEEIRLPSEARQAIRRSSAARRRAERGREEAQSTTAAAANVLVERLGLGVRDAGELLGLSHQRVQQLVSERALASRG
jgi:predicted RNase H-like HicB family nuclease